MNENADNSTFEENAASLNQTEDKVVALVPESDFQSVTQFVILYLLSLGIYPFFWFYKHWRYLKDEKNKDISPGFRTLFIVIYGYSLFKSFKKLAQEKGYTGKVNMFLMFILYVATLLTAFMENNPLALLSFFSFIFLIPVLNVMNFYYLKEQAGYTIKTKLGKDEIVFLVVIWAVVLFIAFSS